ncbi:Gfo/Idh/MocA family protein [Leifsonia poae]|uniref:Gfo/Idh/MocA family protein n=1 Tax=Leifsonia poae TaxID=110933 RepID=UPI001CBB91D1|nr:Gfo/Idh/MocA family oxidoreductase [Leifsonia poae]
MTLRIGVLGAARITEAGLLRPARQMTGVEVVGVAARDYQRATAFASRHRIPQVFASYKSLLKSDAIDAVYIPTPPALHGSWTIAAVKAGKHVLVEKPFTANGAEAEAVALASERSNVVVMEAFHTLFHPLIGQIRGLLDAKAIGDIVRASAEFCAPIPPGKDIRWNRRLGGGALMDLGCYPLRVLQTLLGIPDGVVSAHAHTRQGVDRVMRARYKMPGEVSAEIMCSLWSRRIFSQRLQIVGTSGNLRVSWPFQPQAGAKIRLTTNEGATVHPVDRTATYRYQLGAFRDAISSGESSPVSLAESVAMMRTIDETYIAAGMEPRRPFSGSNRT